MTSPRKKAPLEGNGVIMCQGCGTPLRDHSIATPCPRLVAQMAPGERLRIDKMRTRSSERKAEWRKKTGKN